MRKDGTRRGWCGPCEAKQKAEYMRSPAGAATLARYRERHGYTKTEPVGSCEWCGELISRRGTTGAGNRRFCDSTCRTENKKYSFLFPKDS